MLVSDWLDDRAPPAWRGAGDVRIRAKLWPMTVGRLPLVASGMIALAVLAAGCRSASFITHGSHLSRHVHGWRESRHLPPRAGSRECALVGARARRGGDEPELPGMASDAAGALRRQRDRHGGRGEIRRRDGLPHRRLGRADANQSGAQRRRRRLLRVGQRARARTHSSPTTEAAASRPFPSAKTVG